MKQRYTEDEKLAGFVDSEVTARQRYPGNIPAAEAIEGCRALPCVKPHLTMMIVSKARRAMLGCTAPLLD